MDRIHDADDNGERLFEHLRDARPEVNAWFVLERGTADWERLKARGERRLVAHGSWTWKMLMLNCTWLLSSHIDRAIVTATARSCASSRGRAWRLAFPPARRDQGRSLALVEPGDVELFVVSTEAELASVAGDGTTYRWTGKETRNTGLPRFDRLLAKGRAVPPDQRDLVIVAPTWRQWLSLPLASGSQRRELDVGLLGVRLHPDLDSACSDPQGSLTAAARRGWRVGFMPHPNLQSILDRARSAERTSSRCHSPASTCRACTRAAPCS